MLSPEIQTEILNLHFRHKMSARGIKRKLGINRKSVDRVIKRHSVQLVRITPQRESMLIDFKEIIETELATDISTPAVAIFQKLRKQGFSGGYSTVKAFVRKSKDEQIKTRNREAFFKMDFAVGACAQVDWGEFNDVFNDGVKIHCFVMVLAYSRLIYIEFTRSEKFEQFLRCHENAFRYFGGLVPETMWYDNLPTAVTERYGRLIKFNARFMAYAGHRHFNPHACNKARGNEKGRVENGVKLVRSNFWPTRNFANFDDLVRQSIEWRDEIANYRVHEETGKIPRLIFESEEKQTLMKWREVSYETDEIFSKKVRPNFHIIYETNEYSVPWTLVELVVTVHVDEAWIKFFYNGQFITRHERCYQKNQKPFTKPEHEEGLKEIKPQGKEAHINGQIARLEAHGASVKEYLKCLRHNARSLKVEVAGLLALSTIYGEAELEKATTEILKHGTIGVELIERLLKLKNVKETKPAPLNLQSHLNHIPARMDLRNYDQLLFNKESSYQREDTNETTTGESRRGNRLEEPSGLETQALDEGAKPRSGNSTGH